MIENASKGIECAADEVLDGTEAAHTTPSSGDGNSESPDSIEHSGGENRHEGREDLNHCPF